MTRSCTKRWTSIALLSGACLLLACSGEMDSIGGGGAGESDGGPVSDLELAVDWDPGSVNPPGSCPSCTEQKVGMDGEPFDPLGNESEFVTKDTDGALIIDKSHSKLNRYLWVADTNLPGVVKIDLQSQTIVGRYRTGGASTSRTTVNVLGEAFIGSRSSGVTGKTGVTKILPFGKDCPDTNADGQITTSTGPDDVLPWGQDDCVAWHVETEGDIRGLAAEDISGVKHKEVCKDFQGSQEFNPQKITSEDKHYVWVGGTHGKVYKLDAKTGQILLKVKSPVQAYGMALSGDGKLWIGAGGGGFGFIDTTKCVDQASCDAAQTCSQICTTANCGSTCDAAVKAKYTGVPGGYGITVDYKKRVWRSGYPSPMVMRLDPYAPVNQRFATKNASALGGGIAADADGWVWAAHYSASHVVRVNADTLDSVVIPAPAKGVAVDSMGNVYAIDYKGAVHVIKPGATLADYTLTKNAVPLKGIAYAYSDMTGVQARLASDEPGWYRQVFTPCLGGGEVSWKMLTWDVEAPTGTWVMFNIRAADTLEGLKSAAWYTIACITPPGGKGFTNIDYVKTKLIEVEVRFVANGDLNQPTSVKSARIKNFSLLHMCTSVD